MIAGYILVILLMSLVTIATVCRGLVSSATQARLLLPLKTLDFDES